MAELENNVQSTENTTAQEPEKTFTQADVNTMIQNRLERERKKYPSDEEMTAFRTWQQSQQTEQDRVNALTNERDTAKAQLANTQAELEQVKREKYLMTQGIAADDIEYYAFKIGKLVSDSKTFEQAATEFFKDNVPNKVRVDMTARLDGGKPVTTPNKEMNDLIRGAFK